jgi:methylated-DNA-[protein]-cysteine S-methyltransferase
MRCREVEALWDELRSEGMPSLRDAVKLHLQNCPPCQDLYEEYEGVAFCLSCLAPPEPSCDLAKKVVEHIAQIREKVRSVPVQLATLISPIGKLYVGFKENRITFIAICRGEGVAKICEQVEKRLRRQVVATDPPKWLLETIDSFFDTWKFDESHVDLSDLTPFEQDALKAAAKIPPGEVRSYAWVAEAIGRPKAARAVGQAMARNPIPLLYPCHRVVDSAGNLHNYGYGLEMKAKILQMEGYRATKT